MKEMKRLLNSVLIQINLLLMKNHSACTSVDLISLCSNNLDVT
jgi:hypothetical protein